MILRLFLAILILPGLAPLATAQQGGEPPTVSIRAILHDPLRPVAELYFRNQTGELAELHFQPQNFSETVEMQVIGGMLMLYDRPEVDPDNPNEGIAARVRLDPDVRRLILVVTPAPADSDMPYRMLVIDDSERTFPFGESRLLSMVGVEVGILAGERRAVVRPGTLGRIPSVSEVNDFNMAQTNFHYREPGGEWVTFAERRLQYLDNSRRLFIVYATPGALQPTVATFLDTRIGN